ncbi:MAG: C40 family peptidase, partial [Dermatophilaceae bacterium]
DGSRVVGFDCSGLSGYTAAQAGVHIPRTAAAQAAVGTWISRSGGLAALQPGDLVFFAANPDNKASIHHVGIYAGGGQMVNAARPGTQVRVEPLWLDEYAGAVHL